MGRWYCTRKLKKNELLAKETKNNSICHRNNNISSWHVTNTRSSIGAYAT